MSTKVDEASIVEPHHVQTTVTAKASAASTNSPKISMFAGKSGFVIPKNKLSGSLVPIYRGGKKPGHSDAVNEESTTQVQRKTKWGPDLTQDAAVRKGRALAYQTRVEQITKQLNLGRLEMGENQDSVLAGENADESSIHQVKSKKSELLELEKREAIGELLKLNPTYKAPPDYKPLLKEAKVPVPIKEYPGYNFIGLIFGNASDTQKRLEKETGAKLRVYGTKADTGEKCEIAHSDGIGEHSAYEELYVQISADTYEKVDAAASLLELLVTPVSVNPTAVSTTPTSASGDSVKVADQSQGMSSPYTIHPVGINVEVAQPIMGSLQTPLRPYQSPWFPAGPPQNLLRPPSGFILPPNPSAPMLRNPVQASPLQVNPSSMPSLFGPRPVLAPGLGSGPQNSSHVLSRPQAPVLQHPFMPQQRPFGPGNPSFPTSQPPPAQSSISAPPPFVGNQPPSTGPMLPLGQGGMAWMGPNMVTPQQLNLVTPQPLFVSGAPPSNNISASSTVPPPRFSPMPAPRLTQSSSSANASIPPVMARGVGPTPSPSLLLGSVPPLATTSTPPPPPQSGIPSSISVNAPSFTPIKPPSLTAQKPHHPNSGDFTFQPHRPQNVATQAVPRLPIQNMPLPNTTAQPPLAPNTRPFWPHMPSSSLQLSNQMNPPQTQISPFVGNPTAARAPLRHPAVPHQNPRNSTPALHVGNLGGPLPPRPVNPLQLQQNFPPLMGRPQRLLAPRPQLGGNLSFASGRPGSGASGPQQIYDPFSPTSVATASLQGGNPGMTKNQESDPEYEDLMASVGVK